ncbi:hypothetical protein BUALT_Bualt03G0021200 [Buddleja alternifolia]|uniref:F-box/LRR-repeat protein 15/At3g58940/PEG3-like LRR domain-containing protein n=1 Tax=Buddleja alternifolia TaxID=168488 RepID=A0AAV6XYP7_9LAMI|nr:hypothetical protein BUALT_Bualt03G0021200 [Buddleja alternifolia]
MISLTVLAFHRSRHLRRLSLASCYDISGIYEEEYGFEDEGGGLIKAVKQFPELEELHLIIMKAIGAEDIKAIGISCPMLKSFTFNNIWYSNSLSEEQELNEVAFAVAKNMPNLRRLGLIGNEMKNEGLQAILEGCPHLESLDLRRCLNLDLGGDLGKRCSHQIKCLRRPSDSTHDYGWFADDSYQHKSDSPDSDAWFFGYDY